MTENEDYNPDLDEYENESIPTIIEGNPLRIDWYELNGKAGSQVVYMEGDLQGKHSETMLRISSDPLKDILEKIEFSGSQEINRRNATAEEALLLRNALYDDRFDKQDIGFLQTVIDRKIAEMNFLPKLSEQGKHAYQERLYNGVWDEYDTALPNSSMVDPRFNVISPNSTGYKELVKNLLQEFPNKDNKLLKSLLGIE